MNQGSLIDIQLAEAKRRAREAGILISAVQEHPHETEEALQRK